MSENVDMETFEMMYLNNYNLSLPRQEEEEEEEE